MRHHTPIETYTIEGIPVDVKRDDLWPEPPYPPNAKMRGIIPLLQHLAAQGIKHVGVFDTRLSEASWGVAIAAERIGMSVTAYYALTQYEPRSLKHVEHAGGKIAYVRHNVTPVCYQVAKRQAESQGIYMLPFGLASEEAVNAVAEEVRATIVPGKYKSVVICSGSCTMLAGLVRGLLPHYPQFYSVSAGAGLKTQTKSLARWLDFVPPIAWIPAQMDYYDRCDCECPFPASRFYDCKAWKWLVGNIDRIELPALFWNIGAES